MGGGIPGSWSFLENETIIDTCTHKSEPIGSFGLQPGTKIEKKEHTKYDMEYGYGNLSGNYLKKILKNNVLYSQVIGLTVLVCLACVDKFRKIVINDKEI